MKKQEKKTKIEKFAKFNRQRVKKEKISKMRYFHMNIIFFTFTHDQHPYPP